MQPRANRISKVIYCAEAAAGRDCRGEPADVCLLMVAFWSSQGPVPQLSISQSVQLNKKGSVIVGFAHWRCQLGSSSPTPRNALFFAVKHGAILYGVLDLLKKKKGEDIDAGFDEHFVLGVKFYKFSHTHTQIHIHTDTQHSIHSYTHLYMFILARTQTHTDTNSHTHTHTHAYTQREKHVFTDTHTHTYTHILTYTHTHM